MGSNLAFSVHQKTWFGFGLNGASSQVETGEDVFDLFPNCRLKNEKGSPSRLPLFGGAAIAFLSGFWGIF